MKGKMMTSEQMIQWLKQYPSDTEVLVNYGGHFCMDFDPDKHAIFYDGSKNSNLKQGDAFYNKKIIELGL